MRTTPTRIQPRRHPALGLVMIVLVLAAACAAPAASPSPTPSPTPPDAVALNRATAEAWVAAARAKDAATLAALYAPDGTFDDPPEHQPDRAGVQRTYAEVFAYQQLVVDPAVVLVGTQGAVVSWTYSWCGGNLEPCPSQNTHRAEGVSVLRMADGVITNETLYYIAGGEPS
jgi:hypothetical protein